MRIGIFGGTFDPIHYGHLKMVSEVKEKWDLDKIWFTPVKISPHKLDAPPTPVHHRVEMLKIALQEYPQFEICEVETNREGPSYTIDTINELQESYPEHEFYLIMSDEVLPNFLKWHQPEEIAKRVPFIITCRTSTEPPKQDLPEIIRDAIEKGWTQTTLFEVSATDIRERIKKKIDCAHLVPQKVLDYIGSNHLYYTT